MKRIYKALAIFLFASSVCTAQNKVITFDGVNDYIDLGSTVGTGVRTIEMWFKPATMINSQTGNYSPLLVRDETTNAKEFGLTFLPSSVGLSGQLMFYIYGTNSTTSYRIYSNNNIWNANQWYHVAAVIDPNQGMMMFIDGIKQNSTLSHNLPTLSSPSPTFVGGWGVSVNRFFAGSIDDLRLSNAAIYTSNFTPSCPNLTTLASTIGLWNFNDSSNVAITTDSSGNMNNGIIYGATPNNEIVCQPILPTTISNCLNFDGVNDYVDLGSTVGTGVRTIEMWFKPNIAIDSTLSNYKPLIARETGSLNNADEFYLAFIPVPVGNGLTGKIEFSTRDNNASLHTVYSNANSWNANQWYHVAAIIHPSQGMMLFIDGIKQTATNNYIFPPNVNSASITVGAQGGVPNRFFNGSIDDVRISSSALYTSNFTPSCPDLTALPSTIGLWNFNDSSNVAITIDSSGNMNNGIIYGAMGVSDTICQISTVITKIDLEQNVIYPNPFSNELILELKNNEQGAIIRIFNLSGKQVLETNAKTVKERINTQNLSNGIYFIQITTENGISKVQKVIKH